MANDLRLQVLLSTIDKATRPLKHISEGGIETARALKAARDRLKELTSQQKDVSAWRAQRAAAEQTGASLTAARDRVKSLSQELAATDAPTRAMTRSFQAAVREAQRLKQQHQQQNVQLQGLRSKLYDAGISTKNLGTHERQLREQINATNASISTQGKRMAELSAQHKRAALARSQMEKSQSAAGNLAVNGAAGLGVGYAASRPIAAAVKAFAPNEDSATQLKVSMMDDTGKVSEDFQKITDLATKLGDRLPGTTADFQNMMTMLRRQGLSAQSILGGTGEAAAYLGVQLKMEATEAAEFAAKMQDATRTTEKDMMGLMDTIQRGFYAGVDPGDMLQGFSKIAPVMDVIKKSGIDAAKELAPLLIMMDQAGMEGGSAGNAFRKIFQAGLDGDHVNSANKIAAGGNTGVSFKFTDDKGNFAGLENLYAQVEKLKAFNDVDRNAIIKKLFGDDAETLTTLNTMMNKGLAGYQEVQQKLKTQADLRTRVNEQLNTLTNIMEAAEGSFTNAMAEFGAAVAPDLKDLIKTLGEIANSIGSWARENPKLAGGLVKVVAAIAALAFVFGGLALTMASMLGPFAVLRYGMTMFGLQGGGITKMLGRLLPTLTGLARNVFPMLAQGARLFATTLGGAVSTIGTAILATPIGWLMAAIAALIAAGFLVYKYWKPIKGFFLGFWQGLTAALQPVLSGFSKFGGLLSSLAKAAYSIPIVGTALRLLGSIVKPLFDMISAGISGLIGWFSDLLKPVDDVGGAAQSMGLRFGAAFGNMIMTLLQSISSIATGAVNLWENIKTSFDQGLSGILQLITNFSPLGLFYQAFSGVMNYFGVELPGKFTEFGSMIVNGLVNGLTAGLGAVKDTISSIGDASIGWFKEKLGIHSPSRVFAELGGFTMAGLTQGLEGGQKGPLNALTSMSKQLTAAGTLALGATAMPAFAVDNTPPISSAPAAAVYDSHDTYELSITAGPGTDLQSLEKSVRAMLARIENEKKARQRSKLSDLE
ncbi:phage tail tape measure protein [Pseudomonas sp. Y39-6]|uniref:phage tail tape measure protein n=1 Tax=Pseudomonas sp. Y39-6 TaxID=2749807 RepID=UPI001910B833|nr:phage tail tape measure protein [Pseudomonas sp. Y39-6]QPO19600.1 phage tail tape measure protein [Pseudomonas sp. Y39-6]URS62722.1 phage tail tape measure protein [Pseudomonas sp. Y39-6]